MNTLLKMYNEFDRDFYRELFKYSDNYTTNTTIVKKNLNKVTVLDERLNGEKIYLEYKVITIKEIQDIILQNQPLNLVGFYIENFNSQILYIPVNLKIQSFNCSFSYWNGITIFDNLVFDDGDKLFDLAHFSNDILSFKKTNFGNGSLIFMSTDFGNGNKTFDSASLGSQQTCFFYANFGKGDLSFEHTIFGRDTTDFSHSISSEGNISFKHARFKTGDLKFDYANFKNCNFSMENSILYEGNVSFAYTNFNQGKINFSNAIFRKGNFEFRFSTFINCMISSYKTNFGTGFIDFDNATISTGKINFWQSNFLNNNISFNFTNFGTSELSFMGSKVNNLNIHLGESKARFELIFEEINQLAITNFTISNQMIIHGKLSSLRLDNSSIHGQLKADWKENNIKSAIEKGYNLKKIKDKNNFTKKDNKNIYKQSCLQAAKQFKLLKENYRKTGEYESEDTAYRNYMKYYVKSMKLLSRDFVKKIGYSIFGLISGYGTSVFRILLTCFFTILSFGIQYSTVFLDYNQIFRSVFKGLYFSTITFLTIGYGDIAPIKDGMALLAGIEGFLGLLLMSIVTVVIVRKVIR